MRFTLFCASTALAASLVLSACSTAGSHSIPGGSPAVNDTTERCPKKFDFCYEVGVNNPVKFKECVEKTSGVCDPTNWDWTEDVKPEKGRDKKDVKVDLDPNHPSAVTHVTITTKDREDSHGKMVYELELTAKVGTLPKVFHIGISILPA